MVPLPPLSLRDPTQATNHPLTVPAFRALYPRDSPVVIELGSSLLRAGFASDLDRLGSPRLVYPPWVARARDGKRGLDPRKIHIGYEATHPSSRVTARSAFDGALPANAWAMERVLDGTLDRLGMRDEDSITSPFLLTEPVCCPNAVRTALHEILFEGYDVPGVALGLAPLFSYSAQNRPPHTTAQTLPPAANFPQRNALVVDFGHHSTTVLPIVNGSYAHRAARRVSLGGFDMVDTFMRRLQLANPIHASSLSAVDSMTSLRNDACYVAEDYAEEIGRLWKREDYFETQRLTLKMPVMDSGKVELSPEELARKAKAKSELGRRLYESMKAKKEAAAASVAADENARKKEEQSKESDDEVPNEPLPEEVPYEPEEASKFEPLLEKAYQYRELEALRESSEDDFYLKLVVHNMKTVQDMETRKKKREKTLDIATKQLGEAKAATIERAYLLRKSEDELLATADSELAPDEVKAKRKLRSLRASAIYREQVRKQKEEDRIMKESEAESLRKRKEEDPQHYISDLLRERNELEARVRQRVAANEAGSDRRSQAARQRMKLLAQQISPGASSSKREDDTFGAKDSDWDVYREIEDGAADEDKEDKNRLEMIENDLLEMAPSHAAENRKPPRGAATLFAPPQNEEDVYIVVDRIRTPEIIWQPSLVGNEQVGLSEAILIVFNSIPLEYRKQVIENTFLTGGGAQLPGLVARVRAEMVRNLPCEWGNSIGISIASDPLNDAWRGAAHFAGSPQFSGALMNKADYEEMGVGYFQEHFASNLFVPTPVSERDHDKKRKKKRI